MDKRLYNFYMGVTGHRKTVIAVFIILFVICFFIQNLVGVNYDVKDYLPKESLSTKSIQVMNEEFGEGVPNARVMLRDVTVPEANEYKEKIQAIDGVTAVSWLDETEIPVAAMDEDTLDRYYKEGNALLEVTVDSERTVAAINSIREIVGEDNAITGDAASVAKTTESTVTEVMKISILAVIIVLIILIFATRSWIEPILILIGIGISVILNAGTNLIFGEICFVTNAAGSVLLLAVSLDYSVFLIHRFEECRKENPDIRIAMVEALTKATNSIFSSGVTTIIGFLALILMRFLLGPDLGMALAKGVIISLITVLIFMPALILTTYKLIEKTQHKNLFPDLHGFGRFVSKIMIPMTIIFAVILVPAFLASNSNDYYYGTSKVFGPETDLGQDVETVNEIFGKSDTYALIVPKGDLATEKALSSELQQLPQVTGIVSYVDTVGAEVPASYLDDATLSQLNSDEYTRMIISLDAEAEGNDTFSLVKNIREITAEHYPDEYYLAGNGPSNFDMMKTITEDMLRVNLIAIAAVYLILLLMLRSAILPAILVLCIETAIWINTGIPYFLGQEVSYIAYLIISAVQLGATVDYAILMTDRYREHRKIMDKKKAVIETVSIVTESLIVSGGAFVIVGFLMGIISTHGILAQLGIFIGRGGLLSLLIVLLVLPGLLYIFDGLFTKKEKTKMKNKKVVTGALALMMAGSVLMPAASFADTTTVKEEVIYGNLQHDGSIEKVYAVNIFENSKVVDYGDYSDVKNLTTTDKIKVNKDKITANVSETPFYYEGTLEKQQLPWIVDIEYSLDGKSYSGEELAGKSGALKIHMNVSKNDAVDSFFYQNYALQITMKMDNTFCRDISADGATIANVGSDKQMTYTVFPGKGTDIIVTANVTNFEMEQISINGIKLDMDVDVDTSSIESEATRLESGAKQLDEGAGKVKEGVSEIKEGAEKLGEGIALLRENVNYAGYKALLKEKGLDIDELKNGNDAMITGVAEMKDHFKRFLTDEQEEMFDLAVLLFEGNNAMIEATETYLDTVSDKMVEAENGAEALSAGAEELYGGTKQLKDGTKQLKDETDGIDEMISSEVSSITDGITGSKEVRSYMSDKNTSVKAVQFALKTEPIRAEQFSEVSNEETTEKGFFQKFLDLFRK